MSHVFHTTDVFTTRRFAGNPLAIVLGADDISVDRMQTVAQEFNLSETIFVQSPDDPAHTAKVRIFFPTAEIPFAGHPTIGCAIFLANQMHDGAGDFQTLITLEEVAGLVPVTVARKNGVTTAMFTAPILPHGLEGRTPDRDMAANAAGLFPDDIGFDSHKIGLYGGGPGFLYIPVASLAALANSAPRQPAWTEMTEAAGVNGAYLYCRGGDGPSNDYRGRMYAPTAGIAEDPATGSASAIFSAQLLASKALAEGTNKLRLEQGYEMGRPSDLILEVDVSDGALAAVRVAGSAVPVSSGRIEAT